LKRTLKQQGLDRRDAALATRLCFGVLQNRMLLDWHLAAFCSSPLSKLDLPVLCALRVAAYQLLFLDKIPPSAAVNEAVALTRKHCRNPRAAGMVNGILRSMLRKGELPQPVGRDEVETLSIRYSHPRWLVEAFAQRLGLDETARLLAAHNSQPPITAQVNACRATPEEVIRLLREDGAEAEPDPWLPNCVRISGGGDLEKLSAYQRGLFYVQDRAARLAVTAAGLTPGQRVLDCCAAPGGKSFAAAIHMENRGEVLSCDIHPHKIKLLEAGRDRLGLSCVAPQLQSATDCRPEWTSAFDAVIADVPCSGLGIIRKKPDIRYKDPGPLAGLPAVQSAILNNCSGYVRPGGVLVYSTCTLLQRENEDVVAEFLSGHKDFALDAFDLPHWGRQEGMMTFWPHIHDTDGFFVAKLRRKEGV
jgi:16S rRNA (cytosine967-C5)-methyltransferase